MKSFAGIPEELGLYTEAEIVLQTVPYDGTSTWGKGADKGPNAFLSAAEHMELYDILTQTEVYKRGIYLPEPLQDFDSPDEMVAEVYKTVKKYLNDAKFVTLFGGEHSISIGSIRAFREEFDNLTVLQIDAHADLRPEYEGSRYNHACAMSEASKTTNLIQVGIRSMDSSEVASMNMKKVYFMHKIYQDEKWMKSVVSQCTPKVYVTVDLDAFDIGLMPSTGTPEPGGFNYYTILKLIKKISKKYEVVGFDIVELAPNPNNQAPDFLAAKLYYQMLSLIFNKK
jgi:agmatinase